MTLFIYINTFAQSFTLTINEGYGSGTYQEGDSVHIWSKAPLNLSVFTHWTGEGLQYLTYDNEWHVILYVPESTEIGALEFTAHYDAIPNTTQMGRDSFYLWALDSFGVYQAKYKEINYAIPPNPKAMVFLLHGTGGSGRSFFQRFERVTLVKDLIYNGYAVFGVDANETIMGDINHNGKIQWNNNFTVNSNPENHLELKNIAASRDSIITKFSFPEDIPTFTLGMSNGANFSDQCASALGYNASAHITARGRILAYSRENIAPVIWVMSENDHQEEADNVTAYQNYITMTEEMGQTGEFHIFKRSPLYPQRFRRNLINITLNQSKMIFDSLVSQGYLDDQYYLNSLLYTDSQNSFYGQFGLQGAQRKGVIDQLACANADHVLHADYNKNIIRFFDSFQDPYLPLASKSVHLEEEALSVFPNPTNGLLHLSGLKNPANLVRIYDINGKLRGVEPLQPSGQSLDIGSYPPGIYLLHFRTDDGWIVKRVIRE